MRAEKKSEEEAAAASSAITPFETGRAKLAEERRQRKAEADTKIQSLPGGMQLSQLQSAPGLGVVGRAIVSALSRRQTSARNHLSLSMLALMGGFGTPAHLPKIGELLCMRQNFKVGKSYMLDERKLAIAALTWNSTHLIWLSFLNWMLAQLKLKTVKGILFMSYVEFDESSSSLKLAEWRREMGQPDAEEPPKLGRQSKRSEGDQTVKVFLARQHYAFVVQGELTQNKYVCIFGSLPVPLQGADRSTARATHHCLRQARAVPVLESFAEWFHLVVSASCSDKASSNLKFLRARVFFEPRACHLQAFCTVHVNSTALQNAMKVSDPDYTGIINTALAMKPAGSARGLRMILVDCMEKRFRHRGFAQLPKPDDPRVVHRRRLLHLLLPPTESVELARRYAILDSVLNGGIQDGVYEHYGPANAADIRAMCELMASAVLPGPPPIFQRGRWMRNAKPVREITLILTFGDAGFEALTLWMRRHSNTDAMVFAGNFRLSLGIMYNAIARKDQSGHHELAAVVEGEVKSASNDMHQRASKARSVVTNWLATRPQARMLALVYSFAPAVGLGNRLLHVSGPDFHVLQWQQLLLGKLPPGRQYRTVRAVLGVDTRHCFEDVAALLDNPDIGGLVHNHSDLAESLSLIFRSLTRYAGSLFTLMFSVLSLDYNWLVFLLLVDKEEFPVEFESVSWCRLGSFAHRFRSVFNTVAELRSDTAHAALVGVTVLLKLDTTAIECLFAKCGKLTRAKSATHTETLANLSAGFVVARQRVIESADSVIQPETQAAENMLRTLGLLDVTKQAIADLDHSVSQAAAARTPLRKLGMWRAFVSDFFLEAAVSGRKTSLHEAAVAYRATKAAGGEAWDRLVQLADSKVAPTHGLDAAERDAERQRLLESVSAAFKFSSTQPEAAPGVHEFSNRGQSCSAIVGVDWRGAMNNAIDTAAKAVKQESARKHRDFEQARECVQEWRQGSGSAEARRVLECLPVSTLAPVPSGNERVVAAHFVAPAIAFPERVLQTCPQSLMPLLRTPWLQMHRLQEDHQCVPVPSMVKYTRLTKCRDAGQCVCKGAGVLLHSFFLAYRQSIRKALKPKGKLRELFIQGALFLEFIHGGRSSFFAMAYSHKSQLLVCLQGHEVLDDNISVAIAQTHGMVLLQRAPSSHSSPLSLQRVHAALDTLEFSGLPETMRAWQQVPYAFALKQAARASTVAVMRAGWEV